MIGAQIPAESRFGGRVEREYRLLASILNKIASKIQNALNLFKFYRRY